jgi:hypothetical protein
VESTPTSATPLEEITLSNILQQNDRSNHRNDDDYHCHDQPGAPVLPVSRVLSCLEFLIPGGALCGPSGLLLLSGFLRLCHVLPFSLCIELSLPVYSKLHGKLFLRTFLSSRALLCMFWPA